jgi:hypothetical protein
LGLKLSSSERAKIALVKKVGVKLAFLVVYNDSEIEPWPLLKVEIAPTFAKTAPTKS